MTIGSSDMKRSAVIVLMLHTYCGFSQSPHELIYFVGCFVNGTTQIQFEFDSEEIYYADFQKPEMIYTVPVCIDPNPNQIWSSLTMRDILENRDLCLAFTSIVESKENNTPEVKVPPDVTLYPSEEVQVGVENKLTCFVDHFYPPSINVSWTKNDQPVSEGVSLSRYYPKKDQTFHQFSSLTFTPSEGDIYSCTVEHSALETPKTRILEPDVNDPGRGPDIFCGLGLTLGLLMVAAAVFLIVKTKDG
ncbi:H-2 class II histocompatibility antigen, A-U alpha chain-like [Betta splendens]|uniref:H-2 class II histocompatibility antigen, A-U alpha chain-like n=1 Tax=Betta splendens TaxID=158456 RepID=A0A9W2XBV3_BETSP|nr:H-2 class II histocompatibility antigen, A-U alpha chain-like [Betta splendens]